MDNSPITKSGSGIPVIFGHYVVQKSGFFGQVRRLLTIKESKFELNSLNFEPKHFEVINFDDITIIQVPTESETQFTITLKKNNTFTLTCEARTQCLCEIYRAWDKNLIHKGGFHPSQYPSFLGYKLITPGDKETYIDTKIVLYRTHLEMMHLSLVQSPKKATSYEKIEGSENLINPTLSIPYYLIETLYKTHFGLVIEMRDSLAKHEFLFYDMQKTNNLIARIQSNYKEHTGLLLEINDTMFEQGLVLETVVPKSYELFFFHTKALKVLESGHLMPVKIALSDSYLVEIDLDEELVLQKYDLASINHIVRMVTGLTGIQVTFEDFTVLTYIPPHNHKGLLASNLFTLANWKKNTQEYLIQNDFIHSMLPRYNLRVEGWINNEIELDYEIELIRKFTRSQADENQFFEALHEFNLNARLKNYTSTDNSPLKLLIQMFNKNLKIIMTKEFISYWETYQIHVSNRVKPEFEGSPSKKHLQHSHSFLSSSHDDKSPSSSTSSKNPEDRIKNLLNKYQFEIAEKFPNIRFSTKTLPFMLYRTEELLKAIVLLISSRSLFKELSGNKRESSLYEGFIIDVARLLDSPYPTLSHLSGCFFRALTRFSDHTEQKAESINKNFLLGNKINLMQMISALLAKRVLIKNQDQKEIENVYILSILASLRILKSFVHERKETTNPEDLQMILDYISKPYYFAIFNFLSRYRSIACVYNTTIILNSFFKIALPESLTNPSKLVSSTTLPLSSYILS